MSIDLIIPSFGHHITEDTRQAFMLIGDQQVEADAEVAVSTGIAFSRMFHDIAPCSPITGNSGRQLLFTDNLLQQLVDLYVREDVYSLQILIGDEATSQAGSGGN